MKLGAAVHSFLAWDMMCSHILWCLSHWHNRTLFSLSLSILNNISLQNPSPPFDLYRGQTAFPAWWPLPNAASCYRAGTCGAEYSKAAALTGGGKKKSAIMLLENPFLIVIMPSKEPWKANLNLSNVQRNIRFSIMNTFNQSQPLGRGRECDWKWTTEI